MKPRIAKTMPQHVRPKRDGMDAKHLENIRDCPCAGCGVDLGWALSGMQAHHLLRTEERGLSRKSSDRWAIPLCFYCHDPRVQDSLHHNGDEEAWLAARGIDGRALASALWAARGDLERMRAVVFKARQIAALKMKGAANGTQG